MNFKPLIISILVAILTACELTNTVDVEVPYEKQIYPIAFIGYQTPAFIYVSITEDPINPTLIALPKDVKINIWQDSVAYQCISSADESNLFLSPFKGQLESSYKLELNTQEFGQQFSKNIQIPKPTKIEKVYFQKDEQKNLFKLNLFFDTSSTNLYMAYKVTEYSKGKSFNEGYKDDSLLFSSYSIFNAEENDSILYSKEILIDNYSNEAIDFIDSLKIILYTLDKDTYRFFTSINDASQEHDIFYNPQVVYSNIRNGWGIFGSFSTDTCMINLKN